MPVEDDTPQPQPNLDVPSRSGTAFVLIAGVLVAGLAAVLLIVSPRLQAQLGLTGARPLPTPRQTTQVPLTLDGVEIGVAIWDSQGVCAEVTDPSGVVFRTCATPDPLRPIWAIDAPDEADPAYLIVASPPEVASIAGVTSDGESLDGLTQARELPAAWTVIPLPPGAVVAELVAFGAQGAELGDATCGDPDGTGPDRLGGGCVVPRQD